MLGPVGLVLHVGAGRAAAQLGHGLHEPAHHRATSCKQVSHPMIMCGPGDEEEEERESHRSLASELDSICSEIFCLSKVMTKSNAQSGGCSISESV